MSAYLITFHESDGNDCTVYDTIVVAETESAALGMLADDLEKTFDENGTEYSEDGNELGYYFDCSEDCSEDCEGHGGIVLRGVQTFDTETLARESMARYHSVYEIE